MLFSHPKDFTPVCTTELGYVAKIKPEFDKRNVKVIGLSVDPVESHVKWEADIDETQGTAVNFPMIGDPERKVADLYDMIHPNASDTMTVRSVFVIGPDKKVKLTITYPASTGRNFDEILRVIDSLQLTAGYKVATPGQLEGRRGRHHRLGRHRRGRQGAVPARAGTPVKPYLRVTPPAQQVIRPQPKIWSRCRAERDICSIFGSVRASWLRPRRARPGPAGRGDHRERCGSGSH